MRSLLTSATSAAPILALALALLAGCDDPKDTAKTAATASAKPTVTAVPSAPAPVAAVDAAAPVKKRDFTCPAGDAVTFNMAQLEQDVRKKTGKAEGPITKADLAKVKSINITQGNVDYLDPCVFPFLTGVKDIFLGPGDLDDLKGLEPLTQLVSLRASINKVRDIKPLARMTKMDRLDLGRTQVEDISPLANMPLLEEVALDDTLVEDLSPLAKCPKLKRLSLRNTRVKDLRPLLGLRNLKSLSIQGSPITDTNVLAPLRASGLKIETS